MNERPRGQDSDAGKCDVRGLQEAVQILDDSELGGDGNEARHGGECREDENCNLAVVLQLGTTSHLMTR